MSSPQTQDSTGITWRAGGAGARPAEAALGHDKYPGLKLVGKATGDNQQGGDALKNAAQLPVQRCESESNSTSTQICFDFVNLQNRGHRKGHGQLMLPPCLITQV